MTSEDVTPRTPTEDVTPRTPTGAAEEYHRKDAEVQAALRQDEARKRCRL